MHIQGKRAPTESDEIKDHNVMSETKGQYHYTNVLLIGRKNVTSLIHR